MNTVLFRRGLTASWNGPSDHSVSNHFRRLPEHTVWFPSGTYRGKRFLTAPTPRGANGVLGFTPGQQARRQTKAESSSSSYGLVILLMQLPTPPLDDAVASDTKFRPNFDEDFHLADSFHLQSH
jgi:hypothetical protein